MYNTVISYLQNTQEAEEVTQDVFVIIYKKANTFKGNAKLSTWIYRIAVNKSLNQLQKRKNNYQEMVKEHHKIDFNHPGVKLEQVEKATYLFKMIDKLSESQKTAFVLTYIEGLPQQQVASIMQKNIKAVESLLQRAKANLRKFLNKIDMPEGKA